MTTSLLKKCLRASRIPGRVVTVVTVVLGSVIAAPAGAATTLSCVTSYASYVQSRTAVEPTVKTTAKPTATPTPTTLNGLPVLFMPPPAEPTSTAPAPVPLASMALVAPSGKTLPVAISKTSPQGLFYTPAELAFWKNRSVSGPFKTENDFARGTPGDWKRTVLRAEAMVSGVLKETPVNASNPDAGSNGTASSGALALDTAFAYLVTNDPRYLNVAQAWLMKTVSDPANDLSRRCFVTEANDGINPPSRYATDGFLEAPWVNRILMTYDFLKQSMTDADRKTVETVLMQWGYLFSAHIQWGIETVFPNRWKGDYTPSQTLKTWAAGDPYVKMIGDSNKDCALNARDVQKAVTVRTYADASGNAGPAISTLSLYFNNRRAGEALSIGLIGLLVQEPKLIDEAKRYVTEWLSYSVWADGSQGEYQRNGDYCIAQQGVIYGAGNAAAALTLADGLARKGDTSLYSLKTSTGLFGSQSAAGTSKNLLTPVKRHLDLLSGTAKAYAFERDLSVQSPRPATSLGNQASRLNNSTRLTDNYHDLSYLIANRYYRQQAIRDVVLRVPQAAPGMPPFPGSTGNQASGWGGSTSIFPAMLFMYAEVPSSVWPYPFSAASITYPN